MNILETIVLGLVQGLTEFIPVSSSGHLVIAQQLFGSGSDHTFLEFINIGTVLALVIFFRKRIWLILKDVFVNKNYTLARNILITAIPAGIVGYLLSDFIDNTPFFGSLAVVMVTLAVVGVLMIVLEKLPKLDPVKNGNHLSAGRAFLIGLAQMFALIPGVSRSGSTIITGRLMGLSPAAAAEYSFLASLPIMLGVTLKVFIKSSDRLYFVEHMPMLLLSNLVAFISGLIAIGFLMNYLSKHSLAVFGWYRVGLAAIIAVVLLVK
ncbi:MAG TPA: undecaprenyl-diphosphate phosphatase [Candidatus Saccharimonadales bacterium]|jgi:undecaprenyl-diphosphatase|nr:undecaprenyl-diphosphate phosphatase [Candidatus Saccharimonadales bacterium]